MLKRLFTSNVRVKLLKLFLNNPDQEYFIRELTRLLDEQINSIRRELDNLKKIGLLNYKTKNRKKFYVLNKKFFCLNELTGIINKADNNNAELIEKIQKIGKIDFLLMTGVFIKQEAQVDLLIVGEINKSELANLLERSMDKPIKFSSMNKEEFLYRLKINDKFILDIVKNSDNLVPVNKLEDEI